MLTINPGDIITTQPTLGSFYDYGIERAARDVVVAAQTVAEKSGEDTWQPLTIEDFQQQLVDRGIEPKRQNLAYLAGFLGTGYLIEDESGIRPTPKFIRNVAMTAHTDREVRKGLFETFSDKDRFNIDLYTSYAQLDYLKSMAQSKGREASTAGRVRNVAFGIAVLFASFGALTYHGHDTLTERSSDAVASLSAVVGVKNLLRRREIIHSSLVYAQQADTIAARLTRSENEM